MRDGYRMQTAETDCLSLQPTPTRAGTTCPGVGRRLTSQSLPHLRAARALALEDGGLKVLQIKSNTAVYCVQYRLYIDDYVHLCRGRLMHPGDL